MDKNGKRTGEVLGQMLTKYSFHDDRGNAIIGANIDLTDNSGQKFFNNEIKGIGLVKYILNAKGGETLDFKTRDIPKGIKGDDRDQYVYRGMPFNGKIASARDIGNYAAGYVAGANGLDWGESRFGFDALETRQKNGILKTILFYPMNRVSEGQSTFRAQQAGHNVGYPLFKQGQINRLWKEATNPYPVGPKY